MKIFQPNHGRAFTLLEGLVVALVLALVVLSLIPNRTYAKRKILGINCVRNLKQYDIALRIWEGDHEDKYPVEVPVAQGGAEELIATGNVAACFQVMSNEIGTPMTLVCPQDTFHKSATNFDTGFGHANISYFIGLNSTEGDSQTALAGDDNLVGNGRVVPLGILELSSNNYSWTTNRHQTFGNVLLPDGSVQTVTNLGTRSSVGTYFATNRIVIP